MASEVEKSIYEDVKKENLGYEVSKLGFQRNRETYSVVEERSDKEVNEHDCTEIALEPAESVEMYLGSEIKFSVVVTPSISNDPAMTWESSDTEVATVNSEGVVYAKGVGTATITATVDGSIFASTEVTVSENSYMVTVKVATGQDSRGTVSGGGTFIVGSRTEISATPVDGYFFEKWDDNNMDNPREVVVTGNKTYKASFSDGKVSATVAVAEGQSEFGSVSISPESEDHRYALGTEVTITAVASEGYEFEKWVVGSVEYTTAESTIILVADTECVANFKAVTPVEEPEEGPAEEA